MARTSVAVSLDEKAGRRVTKVAYLLKKSPGAFLGDAGDEVARRIVLDWAVAEYRRGRRTFGELADETGLAIEEIMAAMETPLQGWRHESRIGGPTDDDRQAPDPWLYEAVESIMAKLRQPR